MVKIKVPATSANLGPGYDSFGLALNLFNEYTFSKRNDNKGLEINIVANNDSEIDLKNEDNLILNTVKYLENIYREKILTTNLTIQAKINYPLNRGLGSSANAIIGTLAGLNEFFNLNFKESQLLEYALELEGHPDNIVPAFKGGFTISQIENNFLQYEKFLLSEKLNFLLFIPDFFIKTKQARQVISSKIKVKDASQNIANASLLTAGFIKNDLSLIKKGSKDYIHQAKRLSLNKKLESFFLDLENKIDIPYFLSGSGPTIIFLSKEDLAKLKEIIIKKADKYEIVNYLIETNTNNQGIIISKDGD